MKRIFLVTALIVILSVGCGVTKLYVNGAPANSNLLIVGNTKLVVYAQASRHYGKIEDTERLMLRESIIFSEPVNLPADTLAMSIVLRIVNEKKEPYQLWETFVLIDPKGNKKYRINKLYEGKLSLKEFNLQVPIRNVAKGKYALKIADTDSKVLFVIGAIKYKWKGVYVAQEETSHLNE